jgi:predicted lactoylglutathione lyase
MPHLPPEYRTLEIVLYAVAAVLILFIGYRIGRAFGHLRASKMIDKKEQELFTTQKGFRTLYEQEIATLKSDKAMLDEQVKLLNQRVEEYRKKAAGLGGLFSSSAKKNDAMYALLLENEALEEALYAQNEKLRQERTDGLKETMRATSYRRVLMSQLLNDERIKQYVNEVLADEKRLPDSHTQTASPQGPAAAGHGSDNHH